MHRRLSSTVAAEAEQYRNYSSAASARDLAKATCPWSVQSQWQGSGRHGNNRIINVAAQDEVRKATAEAAVIDLSFKSHGTRRAGRNTKFKTHKIGLSGRNGVIKNADLHVPYLMQIDPFAFLGNQTIRVSMGLIIQKPVGFDVAAVKEFGTVSVRRSKLHPALVEIPLFWHKIVTDFFILYDHPHGHCFACEHSMVLPVQWRDEFFLARICLG